MNWMFEATYSRKEWNKFFTNFGVRKLLRWVIWRIGTVKAKLIFCHEFWSPRQRVAIFFIADGSVCPAHDTKIFNLWIPVINPSPTSENEKILDTKKDNQFCSLAQPLKRPLSIWLERIESQTTSIKFDQDVFHECKNDWRFVLSN